MKNNLLILFVLVLVFGINPISYAQISKKQIKNIVNQSVKDSDGWYIYNKDSAYFKADTCKIINSRNCLSYCDFVCWKSLKRGFYTQEVYQSCKEPPKVTGYINHSDKFKLKIKRGKESFFLLKMKANYIIEKYEVIDIFLEGSGCKGIIIRKING